MTTRSFLQTLGLHPLAAFGLMAMDAMLFGAELETVGVGLVVTIPAGFLLGLATALLQRHAYRDEWGVAAGKGIVLGVLTAIPTPLPSLVTGAAGVVGLVKLLKGEGAEGDAQARSAE